MNQPSPLLGIWPKGVTSACQRDICTPMFMSALFKTIEVKRWKQLKYPSMEENVVYTYSRVLFTIGRNEVTSFVMTPGTGDDHVM